MPSNALTLRLSAFSIYSCSFDQSIHICRALSSGQRGEVYEVNGDRAAVILDISADNKGEGEKDDKVAEQPARPPVYWIDGNILKSVRNICYNFIVDVILQFLQVLIF